MTGQKVQLSWWFFQILALDPPNAYVRSILTKSEWKWKMKGKENWNSLERKNLLKRFMILLTFFQRRLAKFDLFQIKDFLDSLKKKSKIWFCSLTAHSKNEYFWLTSRRCAAWNTYRELLKKNCTPMNRGYE